MLKFLLYSNFWISTGAGLFTLLFHRVFKIDPNWILIFLVGTLTLVAYNFQRIIKVKIAEENNSIQGIKRLEWIKKNLYLISTITAVSGIASAILFFKLSVNIYLEIILAGIFSFFYVVKVPGIGVRLREIPGAKIILISLSYALCCVLLTASQTHVELIKVIQAFSAAFFFILAITIPFDIRDINFDLKRIKTIPQLFGVKGAKIIAIVALSVAIILFQHLIKMPIAFSITFLVTAFFIVKSSPQRHFYFYAIGVDGLLILLPLLIELELRFY